jgi:hypothetical protein
MMFAAINHNNRPAPPVAGAAWTESPVDPGLRKLVVEWGSPAKRTERLVDVQPGCIARADFKID